MWALCTLWLLWKNNTSTVPNVSQLLTKTKAFKLNQSLTCADFGIYVATCVICHEHSKALMFLYAFEESVDCHLPSSFCDDSNLHICLFKYVLSTMKVAYTHVMNSVLVKLATNFPKDGRLRMRNFTWNRFPIKNLLIDSLLTPIAESTYVVQISAISTHEKFSTWKKHNR